jgi:outer membrane protein assembly factor BamE
MGEEAADRKAIIARLPLCRALTALGLPTRAANAFSFGFSPVLLRKSLSTNLSRRLGTVAAIAMLGGCASITAPFDNYLPLITQFGVYKLDINQGNLISQDMVDRLKVGQTRSQVRLALGTPLVMSAFRDQRWDYVYLFKSGGRVREQRLFTVYFQDDLLARWEGDEMPQSAQELNRLAATRSLPEDPYGQDAGMIGKIIDFFRRIGDPSAPPTP